MTEQKQIEGFRKLSDATVDLSNAFKGFEEALLRIVDDCKGEESLDQRWVAIATTHFQEGFMALNRSNFKPQRLSKNVDLGETVGVISDLLYERMIERIAKACHEANRDYCMTIGDNSQPAWEDAPDWQRVSACNGVKHVINNPNATPADSHANWLREKVEQGWAFGEHKDPERKLHPCFVPYDQLPKEQREKDHIFISTVKAHLTMKGQCK